ncbi:MULTISPECIES: MFS transporter [Methylobacterium]|uniref:MFS transporter n=1 Tax=Methylobacterium longum TaxID=767694 RepID=A0ABT8AUP8_9HYPH|nr:MULTISPECIES: MFS transporter [Methylobacterium]MCJ2100584.1 MFS transporter [Methylobacterium sp. E-046]MDN3573683.1 MFS transporter [Methylobacterium longum]GJE11176.1 putative 3-phenylpropionic acid transporter [Methylobacterium longum]
MRTGEKSAGRSGGLGRFLVLNAALYGAYGCLSPILPNVLTARGLSPGEIGALLAAAGALRLVVGPLAGAYADRHRAGRTVLAASLVLTGLATLAHLPAAGFAQLLGPGLAYGVGTAAPAPLADALTLAAARGGTAFQYGWVRAAGSAAFIAATVAAGWLIEARSLVAPVIAGGVLFLAASAAALSVPAAQAVAAGTGSPWSGFSSLIRLTRFRRTVLAAALVIGAHAMHDGFAMILWRGSGIGAGTAGLLWSESVAAEVLVFLFVGPRLLGRIGLPAGVAVAACAGALRWAVLGSTTAIPWIAAVEALHGLSFALLHLACLGLIEEATPSELRTTALALYGTLGLGLSGVLATLASGALYGAFGAAAFWAMAAVSLAALPLVRGLGRV